MQIKQLEAFVQVVKLKSFSKAADSIFLSQPSISAYISSLEDELGVTLIIRSTKEIYPTEAGKRLYAYSNEIINTLERAERDIKSMQTEVSGKLSVAASTVPSQYIIPKIFSDMSRKYENLTFSLTQADSREVIGMIENFDVELGIVGTKTSGAKCSFLPFLEDRLVLITPVREEYGISEMPLERLFKEKFILREEGSGTLRETENFLKKHNKSFHELNTICSLGSTESVKQAVCEGLGVSFVSRLAALDYEKMGKVRMFDLKDDSLVRKFYIAYHKERPFSPAARVFIDLAEKLKENSKFM